MLLRLQTERLYTLQAIAASLLEAMMTRLPLLLLLLLALLLRATLAGCGGSHVMRCHCPASCNIARRLRVDSVLACLNTHVITRALAFYTNGIRSMYVYTI